MDITGHHSLIGHVLAIGGNGFHGVPYGPSEHHEGWQAAGRRASHMNRKVTIRRRSGPDVLARDEPDVRDRLRGMAEDHFAGRHEAEVEREAERGLVALGWKLDHGPRP